MTAADAADQGRTDERELRLALVLYGGVSLAIYMHGATKELHRLVRASSREPDELTGTEQAWQALLEEKASAERVRTRVVIDCVAGTSAGGINGVYLAKALAHDLSQDALRDLWFERGDIGVLLRGFQRLPWKARLPWVVATLVRWPALRGDDMAVWLHDALVAMSPRTEDPEASLMPPAHPLRLFVTTTDHFGYPRALTVGDPPVVTDHRHRHVMEFRYDGAHDGDADDFGARDPLDDVALAFAARATSCFPGAFAPVSFERFAGYLHSKRGIDVDLAPLEERTIFRHYPLASANAQQAWFVDGGVLDNRPFGHAIDAIREAPAAVQVDRRLLYLEPSPASAEPNGNGSGPPSPAPLGTVLAALAGIPRNEPIIDEILKVGRSNERVGQLRDVIQANWTPIAACVESALDGADLANPPTDPADAQLAAWSEAIHEQAVARTGFGHTAYLRVKIGDAVDRWASTLCRLSDFPSDCSQAGLVRLATRAWAREAGLFQDASPTPTTTQLAFLRHFDLGYGERRLRFVIAALNWWYRPQDDTEGFPPPSRAQLDATKASLYAALAQLQSAMRGDGMPAQLQDSIADVFSAQALADYLALGAEGPGQLEDQADELALIASEFQGHLTQQLAGFSSALYSDIVTLTASWHPEARRRLMIRHLGFPIWDAVLFPLQSIADVGEGDAIDIVRLSPIDADLLRPPSPRKLEGTKLGNFGAFFTRAGREGDYLWGRLDTAERLVGILLGPDHPDREAWCHRLFAAILDEEKSDLSNAQDLMEHLSRQLPAGVAVPS